MPRRHRTAPRSPHAGLPLREVVLYAPKRWDRMDAREREFVSTLHACLASGTLCYPKRDRVRLGNGEWGDGEWEIEVLDEYADDETRRAYTAWWPPDAPGYVTMTLDGGQVRRKSATGWW